MDMDTDLYTPYFSPATLTEALTLKADLADRARMIAGGTDLLLEMEQGARRGANDAGLSLIDLTRIPGLAEIREADRRIHLGPLVTHNQAAASPVIVQKAFPLARACWEVGAPQIRNRATVAGNVITASPANDSIVPLLALDAAVTLTSAGRTYAPSCRFYDRFPPGEYDRRRNSYEHFPACVDRK